MASKQDYLFRSAVGLAASGLLGLAGVNLYSPGADISDRAFAGLLLGLALLSLVLAAKTIWQGLTNRRTVRDRRRPIRDSFTNDRRLRNLGPTTGPDRRQGPTDRRNHDRRNRFA